MPDYSIYSIEQGRAAGPAHIITCASDDEAKEQAKAFIDGNDIEVWKGPRMVIWYPHNS